MPENPKRSLGRRMPHESSLLFDVLSITHNVCIPAIFFLFPNSSRRLNAPPETFVSNTTHFVKNSTAHVDATESQSLAASVADLFKVTGRLTSCSCSLPSLQAILCAITQQYKNNLYSYVKQANQSNTPSRITDRG